MTSTFGISDRELVVNGQSISYTLQRTRRRTLGITVEPTGAVIVTAPADANVDTVEAILRRRSQWIIRRRCDVAALPPAPSEHEWVSGETHRYLGRQYRLRVRAGETAVRLAGAFFHVSVPQPRNTRLVRVLMESWFRDHARSVFERRMGDVITRTPTLRLSDSPRLIVRKLIRRWASCSPDGRITVNIDAVKLSAGCIDYLLIHELCHLRVPNHGSAFWRLLDRSMPDWERWRRRLDHAEL